MKIHKKDVILPIEPSFLLRKPRLCAEIPTFAPRSKCFIMQAWKMHMYSKAARRTLMSAGCTLYYSHSIVEGGFEEMS